MSYDVLLRAGSVALNRSNLKQALARISEEQRIGLRLTDDDTLAFGLELSPLDRRAAGVAVTFKKGANSLALSTHARTPLSIWLAGEIARHLDATASDPQADDGLLAAVPTTLVRQILREHEAELFAQEPFVGGDEDDDESDEVVLALRALVRAARIEVVSGGDAALVSLARSHPDGEALYEALLECDAVEDVFLSQSEFVQEIERAKRRAR